MEATLNMGAFQAMDQQELFAVDGGVSEFAKDVVNTGCGIIGGVAGMLVGAAVGVFVGGPYGAAVCGVVGLVVGAYIGNEMADKITSNW